MVERREASVPRHGTRRASLARTRRVSQTRQQHKCACRRSAHPSPLGFLGDGRDHKDQTQAQQRAAGPNNTALFDIVNRDDGQRFAARAATSCARLTLVSRASAARPGTQGDTTNRSRQPYCASRVLRGAPALVPFGFASLHSAGTRDLYSSRPNAHAFGETNPRCKSATISISAGGRMSLRR
jgi:hypothetical protein